MSSERIEQLKEKIVQLEAELEKANEELAELEPYKPWWWGENGLQIE